MCVCESYCYLLPNLLVPKLDCEVFQLIGLRINIGRGYLFRSYTPDTSASVTSLYIITNLASVTLSVLWIMMNTCTSD